MNRNTRRMLLLLGSLPVCLGAITAPAIEPPITEPPAGVQTRWPFYECTQYLYIEEYDIHDQDRRHHIQLARLALSSALT